MLTGMATSVYSVLYYLAPHIAFTIIAALYLLPALQSLERASMRVHGNPYRRTGEHSWMTLPCRPCGAILRAAARERSQQSPLVN